MEAKIVVLLNKSPELLRPEFSRPEGSKKCVGIDRMRLEFQHKRFDVGRDSLNGAHATHIRNGRSLIITMTEATLHDASGASQGSNEDVVAIPAGYTSSSDKGSACFFPSFVRTGTFSEEGKVGR